MNLKELIGQHLGRYHVIEPLGQGGMASVFKAFDTSLERHVAIKVIRPDLESAGDENQGEFLKRFQREARALARLDHPYILKVLDYGEQDGLPYLVMPYVPGGTLKQKMGTVLPPARAASLLAPIARALEYAHKQNIIHRDVKPANILISESGAPLLSDFGIAKIISAEGTGQLTATGVGIGTPDYMAPEQWMGVADPWTDIYSLGVVFYEMVTGHRPFSADTPAAVLVKHLRDPLPRPRSFVADINDDVEMVLYKALAKEPKNRFADMGAFAAALEKLSRGEKAFEGGASEEIETLIAMDATAFNAPKTVLANEGRTQIAGQTIGSTPAPEKKSKNLLPLLLAGAAILALLCLAGGGGAYLFARRFMAAPVKNTPAVTRPASDQGTSTPATETPAGKPPAAVPTWTDEPAARPSPFVEIKGFPDDIPFLSENNGDLITTKNTGVTMFTFSSNLSVDKLQAIYLDGMKNFGWEMVNESTQESAQGIMYSWYFSKGETRMAIIMLAPSKDSVQISIMLPQQ